MRVVYGQTTTTFLVGIMVRSDPREAPRVDVVLFERHLEDELSRLSSQLAGNTYKHSSYQTFYVRDPKFRVVHKATVCDRVAHQALYSALYPYFDRYFFFDSYSCRIDKGVQAAIARVVDFIRKQSRNFRDDIWIPHGDVDDFFASVDHDILLKLLARKINDRRYLDFCHTIILRIL